MFHLGLLRVHNIYHSACVSPAMSERAKLEAVNREAERIFHDQRCSFLAAEHSTGRSVGRGCVFFRFAAAEMESASKGEQADPPAPTK